MTAESAPDANSLLAVLAKTDGYTAWGREDVSVKTQCSTSSATVTFLPASVFRIQTTMKCSLSILKQALQEEAVLRACDATIESLVLLAGDASSDNHTTTVYTSYKQPSVFVAPRDFVVHSTQAVLSHNEWGARCRVQQQQPGSDRTESATPSPRSVFVQCSMSGAHPAAPVGCRGTQYVRGTVHLFGYVATEIAGAASPSSSLERTAITVRNYCCVDPNGSIPQWIVKAAVGQQAEKLAKLRDICEERQKTAPATQPTAPLVMQSSTATVAVQHVGDDISDDSFRSALSMGSQSVLTFAEADRDDDEYNSNNNSHNHGTNVDHPSPSADVRRSLTFASATPMRSLAREEKEGADASASATFLPTPASTAAVRVPTPSSLSSSPSASPTPRQPATQALSSSSPHQPRTQLEKDTLLRLSALARASGWASYEEGDDGIMVEHLARLPFLFSSMLRNRRWPVAVRVSKLVPCSLRVITQILSSDDDEENSGSGGGAEQTSACWDPALFPTLHPASRTLSPQPPPSSGAARVRHYRFEKFHSGEPWSATLTTTTCRLSDPTEGARLGFYTPGMHAACTVWGGVRTGTEAFPADPHKIHRETSMLSFGIIAVAVPAEANLVRLSHYALVDFSGEPAEEEIGYRAHKAMLRQLTSNMKLRVTTLAGLCAARQRSPRAASGSKGVFATVTTRPALWALIETVRGVERAPAQDTHHVISVRGMERTVRVHCVPAPNSGNAGHVFLFTTCVRCSVMDASAVLGAPGGDLPVLPLLQTFDEHVGGLRQLPSPPGAAIFQVDYTRECPCLADLAFCFMEVNGLLVEDDFRAFVVSRVNCHTPGRAVATLHCDGFVVSSTSPTNHDVCLQHIIATDVSESCRDAILADPVHNAFVSAQLDQLARLAECLEAGTRS